MQRSQEELSPCLFVAPPKSILASSWLLLDLPDCSWLLGSSWLLLSLGRRGYQSEGARRSQGKPRRAKGRQKEPGSSRDSYIGTPRKPWWPPGSSWLFPAFLALGSFLTAPVGSLFCWLFLAPPGSRRLPLAPPFAGSSWLFRVVSQLIFGFWLGSQEEPGRPRRNQGEPGGAREREPERESQ